MALISKVECTVLHSYSLPLDAVFVLLLDEAYSFEDVGYVVNPSLLFHI